MSDVGTLDAHQAVINWGDGVSNPGTIANGAVRASHVWNSLGSYTVTVTVTDDDRGVGTREASVNVVDATGLVCGLGSLVRPLLTAPGLDALTLRALTQLLGEIQGNIDGQAFNGACDMFAKDNLVAALVKLAQAVDTIENLIAAGELSAEQHTTLRLVETHLVLTAKARYLELARAATNGRRLADAAALAQLAEAAAAERDNRLAIGHWVAAVRLLAPSATR
jgi:hypothetical protein